jgi:hypothetical protein
VFLSLLPLFPFSPQCTIFVWPTILLLLLLSLLFIYIYNAKYKKFRNCTKCVIIYSLFMPFVANVKLVF